MRHLWQMSLFRSVLRCISWPCMNYAARHCPHGFRWNYNSLEHKYAGAKMSLNSSNSINVFLSIRDKNAQMSPCETVMKTLEQQTGISWPRSQLNPSFLSVLRAGGHKSPSNRKHKQHEGPYRTLHPETQEDPASVFQWADTALERSHTAKSEINRQ